MTDELWRVRKCEHGAEGRCGMHLRPWLCEGGSVEVLDPERVVTNVSVLQDVSTVADVRVRWFLDALGGSDE